MFDYLTDESPAKNIVGSFSVEKDVDFKESTRNVLENMRTNFQMDPMRDLFQILTFEPAKEAYVDSLMEGLHEDEINIDDKWVGLNPQKLQQLFENSSMEMVSEALEYGQLRPIVGVSLPILKKVWLKSPLKDIMMTEVPDKPLIKVGVERDFLKDAAGNKYYIPEIFYNDDYKEVSAKARGHLISDKFYPEDITEPSAKATSLPIQDLNILEESGGSLRFRDSLGYDFSIVAVKVLTSGTMNDASATYKVIEGLEIQPDYGANGTFNYEISFKNEADETCKDYILGTVDAYSGVVSVTCTGGYIQKVKFGGHLQNVNNTETLELDTERELKEWKIPDSTERINTGLPIERIKDFKTLFDTDITAKVISDMGDCSLNFEDSQGLAFLNDSYNRWKDRTEFPYGYSEGFVNTWQFRCTPDTATTYITTPQYLESELPFAIDRATDKLKTKLKREDIMFVLYAHPSVISLLRSGVKWIIDEDTKMGGVQIDYRFGVMTANKCRIHVVSTMKVPESQGMRIVAYPLSKEVITFKHYKYSMNIENSYRNPLTPLIPNVMATSRYLTTEMLPVQGAFNLTNNNFGLVS